MAMIDRWDAEEVVDAVKEFIAVNEEWNKSGYDRDYYMGDKVERALDRLEDAIAEIVDARIKHVLKEMLSNG